MTKKEHISIKIQDDEYFAIIFYEIGWKHKLIWHEEIHEQRRDDREERKSCNAQNIILYGKHQSSD